MTEADRPSGQTTGAVTVLLVDDDETWARTNARLLERQREAFSVVTASAVATAREAYAEHRPDCVVCDYQLDDGDGLQLLAHVRETEPDRPFVLVTGEGSEAVASDAIGRGVTDYVRKSTVAEQTDLLARRIETAVRAHRTERALERERRSKNAVLDIVTASTSREGLTRAFCRHLVAERDYACAWIGTYAPGEGVVQPVVACRRVDQDGRVGTLYVRVRLAGGCTGGDGNADPLHTHPWEERRIRIVVAIHLRSSPRSRRSPVRNYNRPYELSW